MANRYHNTRARSFKKGLAAERRCAALLRADGYTATVASRSHGLFDVVAVRGDEIRFIQVKAGVTYMKARERAAIAAAALPVNASRECWRFVVDGDPPIVEAPVLFPRRVARAPKATKPCAQPNCEGVVRETRGVRFLARRYCSLKCAAAARRRPLMALGVRAKTQTEAERRAYLRGYRSGWAARRARDRRGDIETGAKSLSGGHR